MKKANIKARIKKDELNPVFHFKDKVEDDKVLTQGIIKATLKSGKLELSGKNLKFGKRKSIKLTPFKRAKYAMSLPIDQFNDDMRNISNFMVEELFSALLEI